MRIMPRTVPAGTTRTSPARTSPASARAARIAAGLAAGVAVVAVVAGCGEAGSSGTKAPASVAGAGCAPVAGGQLVVLTDDKKLQTADNIIPAVNQKAATPELIALLDRVSAALDTPKLVALNRAVDIDHKTPQVAARDFAKAANLTAGITAGRGGRITIGAASFSENQTIGSLYEQVLDAGGYDATVQQIGNRELYEPALERNEIQIVPEYAGTLTEFLNKKLNGVNAAPVATGDIDRTVTGLTGLGQRVGLTFGKPSPAADQNAFAVTSATADRYGVRTLSDFAAKCSGAATVLGGPAECPQRVFCQLGLHETYGLAVGRFVSLEPAGGAPTKSALKDGTITLGLVFSSDAALATG